MDNLSTFNTISLWQCFRKLEYEMSSRTKKYPFWLHAEPAGSNIEKLYWGNVRHGEPIPIPESSILRHRRGGVRLHFTPQLSCGDEIVLNDTRLEPVNIKLHQIS